MIYKIRDWLGRLILPHDVISDLKGEICYWKTVVLKREEKIDAKERELKELCLALEKDPSEPWHQARFNALKQTYESRIRDLERLSDGENSTCD